MPFMLRCRGPSGQATISEVEPSTPYADFQALLQSKLGVPPPQQEILAGFPPRPVQAPQPGDPISSVFANGETLVLRELPAPPPAEPAAPPTGPEEEAGSFAASARHLDMDEDAQLAAALAASMDQEPAPLSAAPAAPAAAAAAAAARAAAAPPAPAPPQPSAPRAPAPKPPLSPPRPANRAAPQHTPAPQAVHAASVSNASGPPGAPSEVELPSGCTVVRRIIDSDNSCLFNAVGYVMERSRRCAPELRKVIAQVVAGDTELYNEGFLGMSNPEYCAWILDPKHWGGAIELSILAAHYAREVAAYDIQTKRCDVYGQGNGYGERVMLIYDGLHYDALAVGAFKAAPEELDQTVLSTPSGQASEVGTGAERLVAACHAARQFTNTATFTLRCGVCQVGLKGEKEAVVHAKETGHTNFSEY